ncbi:cryptochrome/photolyase family protein [Allosphingosinicella indica]|uniref:Deoxyribodipyrimidine photolyase-related protein n=1 Tax=Allosphingosinicella indica TaxID=941907 RepID=A0A1X7GZH9_9SPHN|nr:cryptochrome/photolyase family protein [Allosphingosinicella indica]SMF77209.1 deoxyribodipyrimidine photolyase-related protein [Allosphingosinicella indica]
MNTLVPILGDQLSPYIASLRDLRREDVVVLMMEVADETTYVRHHKQKIALILAAMRHFAASLAKAGWTVDYVRLDEPGNSGSFTGEVARAITRHRPASIRIVEAGEWRVQRMIEGWSAAFGLPVDILPDDRFLRPLPDFFAWAASRRELVMEHFYRLMRRRTGLLMQADGAPVGGRWNFDTDNRKPPPADLTAPQPMRFPPDAVTREVLALVERRFSGHFGSLDTFAWPVTRAQAKRALGHFVRTALPSFGAYQDAMVAGEDHLFHSVLSPAINLGLLDPREVCEAAVAAFETGAAPLNSVEGFVRQIIGWREYMRGLYWLEMPEFADANALGADRPLPEFYWTGETDMRCLAECVRATRDNAHAHHIQRLMVLGNFAMLAGVAPRAIHDWFLVVYADAYEWVELPNVIGMSQFADGGRLGSKPYAAGGAYIDRMSDYCSGCRYDVKAKTGPDACPFNALYWDFLVRNEAKLRPNRRLAFPYANWDKMDEETRLAYRRSATDFLTTLEPAAPGWAR